MKNIISYYYNLNDIRIIIKKDNYYVKHHNDYYVFDKVRNHYELLQLYSLTNNNNIFDKIIVNKDQTIFTIYNGEEYVLIKIVPYKKMRLLPIVSLEFSKVNYLLRNNWSQIWSKKIDYIEYQYDHIKGKYSIIDESIDYYIGISENAIQYYELSNSLEDIVPLCFCRRRIIMNKLYNPTNIVVDYQQRDIAEYIKYMYFNDLMDSKKIVELIKKFRFNKKEEILLYSRLLFPSYYFDIYEKIVNDRENTLELEKIIKRRKGYESVLIDIYANLHKLKRVDWLGN